jgi:glycerol-3-phosphate acyltransferase PlsY
LAAATLLLDGAKGFAPAFLAGGLLPALPLLPWLCGLAAVLGHVFPPWLGFRGGKGVATGIGALLGASFPVGLFTALVWLAIALLFRISSLAALSAFALAPLFAYGLVSGGAALLALLITLLVYFRHAANIRRLLAGTEPRFGSHR